MSKTIDPSHEGVIIRLKEHFDVNSDKLLSLACGYSVSSISTWRHHGLPRRTVNKIAKATEGLNVDYILHGKIGLAGTSQSKNRNHCFGWLEEHRRNYCIAYIVNSLTDPSLENVAAVLYELDSLMLRIKNKSVTQLTYDIETKLPVELVSELITGSDKYLLTINDNRPFMAVNPESELYRVIRSSEWRKSYLENELETLDKLIKKRNAQT